VRFNGGAQRGFNEQKDLINGGLGSFNDVGRDFISGDRLLINHCLINLFIYSTVGHGY